MRTNRPVTRTLSTRHPIQCIVPPVLLKQLALEGDELQRAAAIETISLDQTHRQLRAETAARRVPGQRAFAALVSSGGQPNRTIYDMQHGTDQIGPVVRSEGSAACGDSAADEAYDGFGSTYELYWDIFHRDSIDGAGLPIHGMVHYGNAYNNAFWDSKEMLFGDGDGVNFKQFTSSVDVIGHELTHGVTQYEANLAYSGQSGALNESISDVFGSLVKQYALKQDAKAADWLIGAGCVGENLAPALRSMKDPGHANKYDDQPADMDGYVKTAEDHGGVHTNSGIPNRAFYLVADGIGGNAWEQAGKIWYDTLKDPRIRANTGFHAWAAATLRQASATYGAQSKEATAVKNAWEGVKVL